MMIGSDTDAWRRVSKHVPPDQKLLWAGRPGPGLRFQATDILLILFGLGMCAFGTVFGWAAFIVTDLPHGTLFWALCALISWLGGLFFVAGRYLYERWERSRKLYGVTDRKVLVLWNDRLDEYDWLSLGSITELKLKKRRNGEGTIHIGSEFLVDGVKGDEKLTLSFEFIPDAAQVYKLIQDARGRYRPRRTFSSALP